jgi:soluble cytochrome b562
MHSVTAREVAALANLRAARANLKPQRVPQVATDIVLKDMGAILKFFKSTVPAAFDKVPDGPDKKAFREANAQVISAIDDYGKWLQEDLRPHARGSYAIGADAFRRMIHDEDMVDIPLDKLEQIGERDASAAGTICGDGQDGRFAALTGRRRDPTRSRASQRQSGDFLRQGRT